MTADLRPAGAAASIEVHGDVHGSIVYGDHNFVVNTNHGTIVYQAARPRVRRRESPPPPPRAPLLFLDRADEMAHIRSAARDNAPVALHGPEGAGKSTLLRQAASALAGADYPDGVVLINGPGATGVPQGLDDLAQEAFDALYESEPRLKVTAAEARSHLGNAQALFVLDELALPPEALDRIPDLLPGGGLLWAAPHAPRGETARTLYVGGLPRAEALRLFQQTAEIEAAPDQDATLDELCSLAEDLPLALVTLGRWTRKRRATPAQALRVLKGEAAKREQGGARKAAAGVLVWVEAHARRMFGLAAAAGGPAVDRAALIEASGLEEAKAEAALAELEANGLIEAQSPALGMPLVFRQYGQARHRAALDRRGALAGIIVREAEARREDREYLSAQLGNLVGALDDSLNSNNLQRAGAAARLIAPAAVLDGRWDLWYYVFQRLALQTTNRALQARALHELGTRALGLGDRAGAERLLREALQIRESLGDKSGAAYTRHNLRLLTGPPPDADEPAPKPRPDGTPWLTALAAAGLGGLGLLAIVGALAAAVYCAVVGCRLPGAPPATPTAAAEVRPPPTMEGPAAQPTRTAASTATPSATTEAPAASPSATQTGTPTPSATSPPILLTLAPQADAYVSSLAPETNYGAVSELRVGFQPEVEFPLTARAFLRFDLSEIPREAQVIEARLGLWLIGEGGPAQPANRITVYGAEEAWDELKITWGSAQQDFTLAFDTVAVGPRERYYEWDVSELVQAWASGELPNLGLALRGEEGPVYNLREFASREYGEKEPPLVPVLLIRYVAR